MLSDVRSEEMTVFTSVIWNLQINAANTLISSLRSCEKLTLSPLFALGFFSSLSVYQKRREARSVSTKTAIAPHYSRHFTYSDLPRGWMSNPDRLSLSVLPVG